MMSLHETVMNLVTYPEVLVSIFDATRRSANFWSTQPREDIEEVIESKISGFGLGNRD
jgi:hypothetical protein